jgi:hypothetical protein
MKWMMMMFTDNTNYNMAVGYKIYPHANTDQPERHKDITKSIRKIFSWLGKVKHIKQNITR